LQYDQVREKINMSNRRYTKEFKLEVLDMAAHGEKSIAESKIRPSSHTE